MHCAAAAAMCTSAMASATRGHRSCVCRGALGSSLHRSFRGCRNALQLFVIVPHVSLYLLELVCPCLFRSPLRQLASVQCILICIRTSEVPGIGHSRRSTAFAYTLEILWSKCLIQLGIIQDILLCNMRLNKLPFLQLFKCWHTDLVCSDSLSALFIGSRYSEPVITGLCLRKGIYCCIL